MQQSFNKKSKIFFYLISFFIPFLIFEIYFLSNHSNILTVDLGQQYVDFLAFFKNNLFSHPLRLIYNFNQGLGSSFIGTSSYYLTSPFNWLLFLFPNKLLPQAILLIISLKIGSIGLSSYFYWQEKFIGFNKIYALCASAAFALSGYTVAYNLNLMWLDSLILLPLLIKAIDLLIENTSKNRIIFLTFIVLFAWFTNFYTGYMILLFGLCYYLWQISIDQNSKHLFKQTIFPYLFSSIIGTLLASFSLIPTVYELLHGKAQTHSEWTLTWQFPLWKLFSKFLTGAFSFSQMSNGLPNIFLPSILLLLAISYFFNKNITRRAKISSFIFLIFLCLSLSFTPLVLIWHLGQFPVWYPARQSFLLVFYLLDLAMLALAKQKSLLIFQKLILIICGTFLGLYFILTKNNFGFATDFTITISCLLLGCGILLIIFFNNKFNLLFLFGLTIFEVTINLIVSLNAISYQSNSNYTYYTQQMYQASNWLYKKDNNFYRLEKNFNRSDDDPLSDNYYGVSFFNSISNRKVINFINYLGLKNNDNSFENQYSTLATDSILGIKYYLIFNNKSSKFNFNEFYFRPSLTRQPINKNFTDFKLVKNTHALPLLFTSPTSDKVHYIPNNPIQNQTNFLNNVTGKKFTLFEETFWPLAQTQNVTESTKNWHEFSKVDPNQEGQIKFSLTPLTNDPYYLELPPDLDEQATNLRINNQFINTSDLGTSNHLIEIADHAKNKKIDIVFTLNSKHIYLNNCSLWRFKQSTFNKSLSTYLKEQPKIHQDSSLSLSFKINNSHKTTIKSTIPYSEFWFIWDNHHLTKVHEFSNAFVSFNLSSGYHQIKLIYLPITLIIGLIISIVTATIFLISLHLSKKY